MTLKNSYQNLRLRDKEEEEEEEEEETHQCILLLEMERRGLQVQQRVVAMAYFSNLGKPARSDLGKLY